MSDTGCWLRIRIETRYLTPNKRTVKCQIRIEISVIRTAGIVTVVISLDREQVSTLEHITIPHSVMVSHDQTLHVQRVR
jgi:hypothetical protein